ncbi:MAG: RHS repeat-associated core domain-containing protein [Acidobacteria bacterium]|nr:RHS repeat-associated core domain-containing protein [Acidobacteriota bacterium]
MRSSRALLALGLAILPLFALADDATDPALERGIMPDGTYQLLGVDNVDLFRAALSLQIPLGQRYRVGGALSYGFGLTYHSDVWDVITLIECPTCPETGYEYSAFPSALSNAGLGWMFSLGRLIDPNEAPQFHSAFTYVAPDGSEHQFFDSLHTSEGQPNTSLSYTRSGSYMRMRVLGPDWREIEMADGSRHQFLHYYDSQKEVWRWRLWYVYGPFSMAWYKVDYDTEPDPDPNKPPRPRWTITDSDGRTHQAVFDGAHNHLIELRLAAFGTSQAVYQLAYQWPQLNRTCLDNNTASTSEYLNHPPFSPGGPDTIPILVSVTLPDGTAYRMHDGAVPNPAPTYTLTCNPYLASGTIRRLFLPTGGGIEWTFADAYYGWGEPIPWGGGYASQGHELHWPMVGHRALLDAAGVALPGHSWSYRREVNESYYSGIEVEPGCPYNCGLRYEESRMVTTNPDGNESVFYGRAYPGTFGDVERGEYGLGFTRRPEVEDPLVDPEPQNRRFLSTQYFQGAVDFDTAGNPIDPQTGAPKTPLRTVYRAYALDVFGAVGAHRHVNRQVKSERTVYEDDPGCAVVPPLTGTACFSRITMSDFDGLGHYRTTTLGGNFGAGDDRVTWVNFNPTLGNYPPAAPTSVPWFPEGSRWIINTFTDSRATEGGVTARQMSCFDPGTGFLRATRTYLGDSPGNQDVLRVFTPDPYFGNFLTEEIFGGDLETVPAVGLYCPSEFPGTLQPVGGAAFRLDHMPAYANPATYVWNPHRTTHYSEGDGTSVGFYTLDQDIDQNTGLPYVTRDSAGLATDLSYDTMGRLVWSRPQTTPVAGDGWTDVVYYPALGTSRPWVHVITRPNGGGNSIAEEKRTLDAFGRLAKESRRLPNGSWNQRLTTHDAMGRRVSVTEWQPDGAPGSALRMTTFSGFDPFGRPATITPPDGASHAISLAYTGARITARTFKVWTPYARNELPSTTTETYDRQGRLWKLTEPSGKDAYGNPAATTTTYAYDVGERLRLTSTTSGSITQTRSFNYDNRGFLGSEDLPEKAVPAGQAHDVTYLDYNALGFATRRIDGGGQVRFGFDPAGRPTTFEEWTGSSWRLVRELEYDKLDEVTQGYSLGKLVRSTANNYYDGTNSFLAEESFWYGERAGRIQTKTTRAGLVAAGDPFTLTQAFTWTPLGQVDTLTYPQLSGSTPPPDPAPGRTITNNYANGALTRVSQGATAYASSISYHPNRMVDTVVHGNNVFDVFGKDPNDMARPASIAAKLNGSTVLWQTDTYAFDGSGNIKSGPGAFRYDLASRLVDGAVGSTTQCAMYDAFGNITAIANATYPASCAPSAISVDSATNRLLSPSLYDAAGRMTRWGPPSLQFDYAWYPTDQMRQMTGSGRSTLYAYTANGERLAWTDSSEGGVHYTLRDLGGKPIREYYENQGTWKWYGDYVWREGLLLAKVHATGVSHAHLDHLGSTRRFTDAAGNLIPALSRDYLPFGQIAGSIDTNERIAFTGHERDFREPTGSTDDLDYMHARYYNLNLGRFLSPDPVRGDARSPQSFNLYAYVRNNPVNLFDPFGLDVREVPCGEGETGVCFVEDIEVTGETEEADSDLPQEPLPDSYCEFLDWERKQEMRAPSEFERRRHDLVRARDYESRNICAGGAVGVCGTFLTDRLGRRYFTLSGSLGKSWTSVAFVWAEGTFVDDLSAEQLENAITGWGGNAGAGALLGLDVYRSFPSGAVSVENTLVLGGQGGASFGYTWRRPGQ